MYSGLIQERKFKINIVISKLTVKHSTLDINRFNKQMAKKIQFRNKTSIYFLNVKVTFEMDIITKIYNFTKFYFTHTDGCIQLMTG